MPAVSSTTTGRTSSNAERPDYSSRLTDQRCGPDVSSGWCRSLVPRLSVEQAPSRLRSMATPLLEEEGHAIGEALVSQLAHPRRVHGASVPPRLPASDEPVDAGQVYPLQRPQQGFGGDEPDRCRNGTQPVDPVKL